MKTKQWFNMFFAPVLFFSLITLSLSCDKDDDPVRYTLAGNATGAQEVPSVTTVATATITGTYNADNNSLTYTITWTGLSGNITAAHFHGPAAAGTNAPPMVDIVIGTNGTSGTTTQTVPFTDAQETALLAGTMYYNLHTAANPNGEIRGQISTARI